MLFAPLVVLLVPVAIILWLPTLLLVGLAWVAAWPLAAAQGPEGRGAAFRRAVGKAFRTLLTPWTYFDAAAHASRPAERPDQP